MDFYPMSFARLFTQPVVSLFLLGSVIGQVTQDGDSEAVFVKGQTLLSGEPSMRDHAGARRNFEQAVEAGHVKASGMLGYMLAAGLGGPKDEQRAVALIRRAADAGIASAQLNLGIMLLNGSGTPRDVAAAVGLLVKAGENGSIEAHRRLGDLYYFGAEGVPVDYPKALPHVKATAVAGNSDARNVLGTMFEFGQGTAVSHTDAMYWLPPGSGAKPPQGSKQSCPDDPTPRYPGMRMWWNPINGSCSLPAKGRSLRKQCSRTGRTEVLSGRRHPPRKASASFVKNTGSKTLGVL